MRNRNLLLTVTAVMSFLGISAFAKDADGRSVLSSGDQQKLTENGERSLQKPSLKIWRNWKKKGYRPRNQLRV